jgi:hypothetical protein
VKFLITGLGLSLSSKYWSTLLWYWAVSQHHWDTGKWASVSCSFLCTCWCCMCFEVRAGQEPLVKFCATDILETLLLCELLHCLVWWCCILWPGQDLPAPQDKQHPSLGVFPKWFGYWRRKHISEFYGSDNELWNLMLYLLRTVRCHATVPSPLHGSTGSILGAL